MSGPSESMREAMAGHAEFCDDECKAADHHDWQSADQRKQPRYVIMMISVTEERGVEGTDWRLSLGVPAGWRLVQVLASIPAPEGQVACALERVD